LGRTERIPVAAGTRTTNSGGSHGGLFLAVVVKKLPLVVVVVLLVDLDSLGLERAGHSRDAAADYLGARARRGHRSWQSPRARRSYQLLNH